MKLKECSIHNAFVLEDCVTDHVRPNKRRSDFMSFKIELAHSLIGNFTLNFKRPRTNNDEIRLDEKEHWPNPAGSNDHVCVVSNKKKRLYG